MSEKKTITVQLNDGPVELSKEQWPVEAWSRHKWWDNEYEFQANRRMESRITVRRRADGRRVVYGVYEYDSNFQNEEDGKVVAGRLLAPEDDPARAVRDTANELIRRAETVLPLIFQNSGIAREAVAQIRRTEQDCIADFPPQKID